MQRHKIVARIILLMLSIINLALAAPVLTRGLRKVPVDVAEDVTTASRKRWIPFDYSNEWRTDSDAGLAEERTNTPHNASRSSLGSRDSDNPHPSPSGSPPPAPNNSPLGIDSNTTPQPSQELELTQGSDSGSRPTGSSADGYESAGSSTHRLPVPSSSSHLTAGYDPSSDSDVVRMENELSSDSEATMTMSPTNAQARPLWWPTSAFEFPKTPPGGYSSDESNPPSRPGGLNVGLDNPLSSSGD